MSEIRDKTELQIKGILLKCFTKTREWTQTATDKILSISELAIVDRKAKLPYKPYDVGGVIRNEGFYIAYDKAQQDMLKAGWVKEVKDELH